MSHNQSGFTLIQAIFALVVLSLLGIAMMRLIGSQSATSVMAVQQARAYQAARSGLDWGAARAASGDSCDGNFTIDGFTVVVSCSTSTFSEGAASSYPVCQIHSTATFGTVGSPDRVSREVQMRVGFP